MNDSCQPFDALIARAAHLTAKESELLEAHLAGCSGCRDLARVMKPLAADFAFTATLEVPPDPSGDTPPPDAPPSGPAPKNRYRITGEVGRGGLGRVLQALDQVLDRPVAIKELFSANAALRRRFVREALITARLQHPSIVPIYDVGQLGDRSPFYAMKLVAGQPLDKAIEEATTLTQRLALLPRVLAVADAMAYAHSKRIIHRDLKPANVLVGAFGETIVIDWGLAKDLAANEEDALGPGPYRSTAADHTAVGDVLGTPAFMAPEQAAAAAVDERTDVYALGAILYHLVSGEAPHDGATLEEVVERVVAGDVRPLAEREPAVPRDLAAIVSKAMALAPSDRYANAGGLAEDLRRFLTGQLVASHSYGVRELVRRWVKRHRAAVTVALAASILVAVVGAVSVVRVVQARRHAEQQRAIAEQERNTATEMLAHLFEEQGRQELLAGRPARAAAYLSEARANTQAPGVGLRTLLAEAMRSVEAERLSLNGHFYGVAAAAFSPDGKRVATAGFDEDAIVWDAATGDVVAALRGHQESLQTVAFSADGARLVTTGADLTARIWDARTGKLLFTLTHSEPLWSAAFSPDGAQVVTTGEHGALKLWETRTGKPVASLEGHQGNVYTAAFSADGTRLVTASDDRTAKVWDVGAAKLVHSLEGHQAEVISAAFSPDGAQLLTASDDHTARIWDAATGAPIASLVGHGAAVHAAAYSRDGARVITASLDRTAKLWDARTGKLLATLEGHTGALSTAAFSADDALALTAADDRTTKLWDVRTGELLASFEGHRGDIRSASFSPDGTQVLTASNDGTAKLWRVTSRNVRIPLHGAPEKLAHGALSPDGATLVTAAEGSSEATLWEARTGARLRSLQGHRGDLTAVAFNPAGTRVATASADHSAKIWDVRTGALLVSLDHPVKVMTIAFSSDGGRVVTSGLNEVRVWNATSGALITKLERRLTENPVRLSKDGARILTSSMWGIASIKSVDTGAVLVNLEGSQDPISAAAFSQDGERVATTNVDRTVKVWNARTGKLLSTLEGTTRSVFAAWFSGDGARLITMSDDNTAKLWDSATGKLLASYDGHRDAILDVSFGPEEGRVLTISADRTVKLWDERTGKLLASLEGHTADLLDARFSADGSHITTASRDGSISRWDVHLEQRGADELRRIVAARNPWTLSNGVLVPDRLRGNR